MASSSDSMGNTFRARVQKSFGSLIIIIIIIIAKPSVAQLGMFCAQEVGNVTSFATSRAPSDHTSSSLFVKRVARNGSPPWREDDKDGHYIFALGENLTSRYKIHSKMGEGTFGQVLECWDRERKEMVAIKIVRGIKKYREAAMIEVEVLQQLGKHDKDGNRCVQIRNWFDYRNHICIVFEKLGPSLYKFLRKNNYRSFPIDLVREIGRQLLECVAFMHDLHLIHTDLKPENILLVSSEHVKVPDYKGSSRSPKDGSYFKKVPKSSAIKVIDFGSTTYDRQDQSYIVSIRHYQAPEVILGYVIPKGCFVVPFLSAVHLDENLYEGAITFNPWRWMDPLNQAKTSISSKCKGFLGPPTLSEVSALYAFKETINEDPFTTLSNWNVVDADPCDWSGISCSVARDHVLKS
ncbi:hypothetical protein TEA_006137 [Camellia sinensis var. sinensis]|uniref:Protein kinase domain-containing protein n=1 Tax=Camellia sinensis var. sinensis TaxID=542762 RepID=A0A4S4DGB9_CAMSN|nr:hypothetical protein TEA_006137 [Camellia sinensis var. sinensis]